MNWLRSISILLFFTLSLSTFSQTRSKARSGKGPAPAARAEKLRAEYELRLRIAAGGRLELNVVSPNKGDLLDVNDLDRFISDLPTGEDKWNRRSSNFPTVVVEADPELVMLDVFNPITLFRSDRTDIRIEVPNGPTLLISRTPKTSGRLPLMPDPLTLVVIVDEKGMVGLNNEPMGQLRDLGALKSQLKEIFRQRDQNAVFRKGTNEIERTVTIKMPLLTHKFRDLINVAIAVQEAGSDLIKLQPNFLEDDDIRVPILK